MHSFSFHEAATDRTLDHRTDEPTFGFTYCGDGCLLFVSVNKNQPDAVRGHVRKPQSWLGETYRLDPDGAANWTVVVMTADEVQAEFETTLEGDQLRDHVVGMLRPRYNKSLWAKGVGMGRPGYRASQRERANR